MPAFEGKPLPGKGDFLGARRQSRHARRKMETGRQISGRAMGTVRHGRRPHGNARSGGNGAATTIRDAARNGKHGRSARSVAVAVEAGVWDGQRQCKAGARVDRRARQCASDFGRVRTEVGNLLEGGCPRPPFRVRGGGRGRPSCRKFPSSPRTVFSRVADKRSAMSLGIYWRAVVLDRLFNSAEADEDVRPPENSQAQCGPYTNRARLFR